MALNFAVMALLVFCITFAFAGCGGASPDGSSSTDLSLASERSIPKNLISIDSTSSQRGDHAFSDGPLTITAGTTITWVNNDVVDHSITSIDGFWDSGRLKPGQRFSYTFNTAGTFDYICVFSQTMQGRVQVISP